MSATRDRWTPQPEGPAEQLCNGETAQRVIVTTAPPQGPLGKRWLLTLDIGWAQSLIAVCDYNHDASGVAQAVALALNCDVEWLADDAE